MQPMNILHYYHSSARQPGWMIFVVIGLFAVGFIIWGFYNYFYLKPRRKALREGLAGALAEADAAGVTGTALASAQTAEPAPIKTTGVVRHDVVIGGQLAFSAGEMVYVAQVSPDVERPQYKYVVRSDRMGQSFRLSDEELMA